MGIERFFSAGIKDAAEGIVSIASGVKTLITGKLPPDQEALIMQKMAELETQAMKMQADINLADAQSNDKFQSRWRPFIGWVGGIGLAVQFLVFPLVAMFTEVPKYDFSQLINLVIAILGLGALRTYEKSQGVN